MFRKKNKSYEEIERIIKIYQKDTGEITDKMAMDMLDSDKQNDFLLLLNIADHTKTGKSRAILTAFKLGYIRGKSVYELDFQDIAAEAAVKLQKSYTALQTTIDANCLDKANLTRDEMIGIGANASKIFDMITIAGDYVHCVQKKLEGILA